MSIWLRTAAFSKIDPEAPLEFPYSIPVVRALSEHVLELKTPVTFLVGENGSGKSTLIEALAVAAKSITVGARAAYTDPTLVGPQRLAHDMHLVWGGKRNHRGFFMRAEDFFGFAKSMNASREELRADIERLERDETLSPRARGFGIQPFARELSAIENSYGEGLDARSHGEAFLALFQARLVPDGLYLLDEPEAPLSPRRQIALLAIMKDAVENHGAQFVVATHSPILMSYPGATIYSFDEGRIAEASFDDLDHVVIMRDFLAHPDAFLRHL